MDSHWLRHATELLFELNQPEPLELMHRHWATSPNPNIFRELLNQLLIAGNTSGAEKLVSDYRSRFEKTSIGGGGTLDGWQKTAPTKKLSDNALADPMARWILVCQSYFALGDYTSALDAAQKLCRSAPSDQYFLALLVTALRCLDDRSQRAYCSH